MSDTSMNQPEAVSYQKFYDELSPYGRWVDYPGYGYVWSPSEIGFRPYYTNGYWGNTNMGWSWVSEYNWGWAPFHYGRWFYEGGYGWLWMPGYEWAPAWVSWRNHNDYYGWAPLAPGMGLSANVNIPFEHWAFIPHERLNDRNFRDYAVDERRNEVIYQNSAFINNTGVTNNKIKYIKGPDVNEVIRYGGGKPINAVVVRDHQQAAKTTYDNTSNEMRVFKPSVKPPQKTEVIKPRQVTPYKDLPHDNGRRGTFPTPPANKPTESKPGGRTGNG